MTKERTRPTAQGQQNDLPTGTVFFFADIEALKEGRAMDPEQALAYALSDSA